jgi:hypothetical protein
VIASVELRPGPQQETRSAPQQRQHQRGINQSISISSVKPLTNRQRPHEPSSFVVVRELAGNCRLTKLLVFHNVSRSAKVGTVRSIRRNRNRSNKTAVIATFFRLQLPQLPVVPSDTAEHNARCLQKSSRD